MRILIADDDATSRLVLKAMATKLDHECLEATDGSRAWELLESGGVDVLLTDWMMPGVDGPELCRRVRHELSDQYIYAVLITALGNHEQVLEGMRAGADDYLVKPVDPFSLKTRLVAAERVTALHRQLVDVRAQLERATAVATERSLTDSLTGLGNRRRMEEELASAHARALRSHRPYGMAMFDIDFFKSYNDHYGHLAGDEILIQVAQCFRDHVRAGESIYRYGGEEFLWVLSEGTLQGTIAAAERIRHAVAALEIPHASRPHAPRIVTISGGVSSWSPGSALSVSELVQLADGALFDAKSSGRNRIEAATPAPPAAVERVPVALWG